MCLPRITKQPFADLMNMIERRLRELWTQLQGKKPHLPHFLSEIHLRGIRGIDDLRVPFDYPVSVIAGENASGKSTVLFAAACAYKVPGAGPRAFVPSTLFPDYRPAKGIRQDQKREIIIKFDYSSPQGRIAMQWRRAKGWNRSFLGRKNVSQPERPLYLRTLSNLSNPSEVRSVLGMTKLKTQALESPLTASQIAFAHSVLPFQYAEVVKLSSGSGKSLLFAAHQAGASYSELHMAAGERAVLRLSAEIAQLDNALVLIDEVEAGLHPWVQQLLMLQLQQLALRRSLQIIVTSHSPVVLDSVPPQARIFLEREESGRVCVRQPYRDIVQNALYGRSGETLNILCEDEVAEGILLGILDHMTTSPGIRRESIVVGRNTGADEFPAHAAAFRKFGQIERFVFILDGDQNSGSLREKIQKAAGYDAPVMFLPGSDAPETWVWSTLRKTSPRAPRQLGSDRAALLDEMGRLDAIFDSASDRPSEIAKEKIRGLATFLNRNVPEICRTVAQTEAAQPKSDLQPLVEELTDVVEKWRAE